MLLNSETASGAYCLSSRAAVVVVTEKNIFRSGPGVMKLEQEEEQTKIASKME